MNIYRGLRDEKSDPCQKHSGDKVPANFRGRRRKKVAFGLGWREAETLEVILKNLVLVLSPEENTCMCAFLLHP